MTDKTRQDKTKQNKTNQNKTERQYGWTGRKRQGLARECKGDKFLLFCTIMGQEKSWSD